MAEQNPIRYSDLISPDDSIEQLIGQLEQLNTVYTNMANNVRSQAQQVASSLKSVSGATEAGRKATREANDEAARLEKAYKQLDAALSENAKEIARLNVVKREANNYQKLMVLRGKEEITTMQQIKEASYQQLSAQYSLNKAYLNNLSAIERENGENKKLVETTKEIYEQMKRLQEATGKYSLNVGNYENAITSAIGVNTKWYSGIKEIGALFEGGFANGIKVAGEAVAAFGKQLLALLANPIVLTIAAVTAAFMALAKGISTSEENTNTLSRVLAPFKRILEGILGVLQDVATFVLKVVEGFEGLAMGASKLMERLPLVGNAFRKVNQELERSIELEREKQQLQKDNRQLTTKEAKTQYEIAVLRRKAQQTNDPREQAALLKKAVTKERQMSAERVSFIERELKVMKEKAAWNQTDTETLDAIARKEAELWNARTQAEQRSLRMVGKIRAAENKGAGGGGGSSKTTNTGLSEEQKAKNELTAVRKLEDMRIALISDSRLRERMVIITNYDRQKEDIEAKLKDTAQMTEAEVKALNETIIVLEQQKQQKLAELLEKEAKEQQDAEKKMLNDKVKAIDDMEKAREAAIRKAEEAINLQYELEVSNSELEDAENKKTQMRLEAEKKRLQALLALYEKDGKILTDKELEILRNNIAQVDKELEKNSRDKDIYDMLGFNLSDEQKEAIETSISYALDSLNQFMEAYAQAAEQKRQLADAEVERTHNVLQAEIEARANGYANDIETARKEYEESKKMQRKAIEDQKKAQKAQQLIDSATQTSSLITATANIWKSFSGIGPWGTAAAVAAIALMWGSFAASKLRAAQLTKSSTEEYGEGTVELLEGGSHQSGNDIDLGHKKDGTRRRAEGGEYFAVINKRSSRRYRSLIPDVINSLNAGTFSQKYIGAYPDGGLNLSVETRNQDITRLSDDVRLIREQGERTRYIDGNGNTVERYKNLRRIIRN